jgi:hypothetical protein
MKPYRFIKYFIILALGVLSTSLASAQVPTERAASGNAQSASASARIDATNESIRRFVSTQEGLVTGIQTTVLTTNTNILTRLGQMRDTLINFNPVAGCDPELGPHGCACACSGPNQKLLWNGTAWTCYQAACPPGQNYDASTCNCRPCDTCTPVGCPAGLEWLASGNPLDVCGISGQHGGSCVCPYSGLPPAQDALIDLSIIDPVATSVTRQGTYNCLYVTCPSYPAATGFTGMGGFNADHTAHSCGCACGFERVGNECRLREGICPEGQTFVGCLLGAPTCQVVPAQ